MEVGLVKKVDIDSEMQQAYLDYAMSVIVARALPDARDGLKPVQRRILYAMHDLNLSPDLVFKKSARVVGEVLGKYHPHGDVAVYEAMARQAQDFSLRYPLVDGQGNFGSIDGDPPAAMRYTEVRLTHFATEILAQIDRNTVDFIDNFDGTLREPEVLPAAVPNLLVNGATGIAVGMATSIPPHNLAEVIDALTFMLANWERLDDLGVEDLMRFVKGPDFPTGGIILQEGTDSGLLSAYGSGKGRITVRGRVHAEDMGRGRSRMIISELPYQINKTTLIERIAELVRDGALEGIADLRDESDRQGMRIVIELKQGVEMEDTLRALYHRTPLQSTFGISLLALVDGEPRLLNLKQALRVFVEHRLTVVKRRSEFDLARAKHRAHILEGLRVALKNLDEIIALIRNSPDAEQARTRMMKRYSLTEIQAQAILDMQLRRLASLERKKIEEEYKEISAQIKELESLLHSAKKMREVVGQELAAMKLAYGDRRRTQIFSMKEGDSAKSLLTATDMTEAQSVWVGVTADGKIGRTTGEALPDVLPRYLLRVSTHETLYLATTQGQAAAVAVHVLPEVETFGEGVPLNKASSLEADDRLAFIFNLPAVSSKEDERFILTASRAGMVKKSPVDELSGPSAQRFTLAKVNSEDELLAGLVTDGKADICLMTAQGMGIRFSEEEVRPMGLVAAGVMGIKLGEGDALAAVLKWDAKADLVLLASDGTGWRVAAAEFPRQGRYGQGVIACRVNKGNEVVGAAVGNAKTPLLAQYQKGDVKRIKMADFPGGKRGAKGGKVLVVKTGNEVVGLSVCVLVEEKRASRGSVEKNQPGVAEKAPAASRPPRKVAAPAGLAPLVPAASKKPSAEQKKKTEAAAKSKPTATSKRTRTVPEVTQPSLPGVQKIEKKPRSGGASSSETLTVEKKETVRKPKAAPNPGPSETSAEKPSTSKKTPPSAQTSTRKKSGTPPEVPNPRKK
jgi:DNA gyrase subunit A